VVVVNIGEKSQALVYQPQKKLYHLCYRIEQGQFSNLGVRAHFGVKSKIFSNFFINRNKNIILDGSVLFLKNQPFSKLKIGYI